MSRLYRLILRLLLPRQLYDHRADEILCTFEERLRDARGEPGMNYAKFLIREVFDVFRARLSSRTRVARNRPKRRGLTGLIADGVADARVALRQLSRAPSFAVLSVLMLGLGIGVTTSIYTFVDAILLRPLPYTDADRLVQVYTRPVKVATIGFLSIPEFEALSHADAFEAVFAYQRRTETNVVIGSRGVRMIGSRLGGNAFAVLGSRPLIGRLFDASDTKSSSPDVVVLSLDAWRKYFGGRRSVVGEIVRVAGKPVTVIGVARGDLRFPVSDADFWMPLRPSAFEASLPFFSVLGKLRPNETAKTAGGRATQVLEPLWNNDATRRDEYVLDVTPLRDFETERARPTLLVLLGAVLILLLTACSNVSNLVLTRSFSRRDEFSIRDALGASRSRIIRQVFAENLVLAGLGGVLGVALALITTQLMVHISPVTLPRRAEVKPDGIVLLVAIAATIASAVVFAVLPALTSANGARRDLGSKRTTAASRDMRALRFVSIGQVAFAFILLSGAAVIGRSFVRLVSTPTGFDAQGVLTMRISISKDAYKSSEEVRSAFGSIVAGIRDLSGVEGASGGWSLPFTKNGLFTQLHRIGQPDPTVAGVSLLPVTTGFFATLRVPVKGRAFNQFDIPGKTETGIVNKTLAQQLFGDVDPIGKVIVDEHGSATTIVGVVNDLKRRLDEKPTGQLFVPFAQTGFDGDLFIMLRTNVSAVDMLPQVRTALDRVQPGAAISDVMSFSQRITESVAEPRFRTYLLLSFAASALLLTILGVYSVTAFAVAKRSHEIGIRLALGATHGRIVAAQIGNAAGVLLPGLLIGIVASMATSRAITALVFELQAADAASYLVSAFVLSVTVLVASWVPARAARRVPVAATLRADP